jgi:hypothetical protein
LSAKGEIIPFGLSETMLTDCGVATVGLLAPPGKNLERRNLSPEPPFLRCKPLKTNKSHPNKSLESLENQGKIWKSKRKFGKNLEKNLDLAARRLG